MDSSWLTTSGGTILGVLLSAIGIYASMLLLTRVAGTRSFSKMSSFDFAVTVAIGSVLATTALSESPSLAEGAIGLAVLYGLQIGVATLRRRSGTIERLVSNQALLLMAGSRLVPENMKRAKVTECDLRAKLREANVTDYDQVLAVVQEATGDVSVLHATSDQEQLDVSLLRDVVGYELLEAAPGN